MPKKKDSDSSDFDLTWDMLDRADLDFWFLNDFTCIGVPDNDSGWDSCFHFLEGRLTHTSVVPSEPDQSNKVWHKA